MVDLILRPGGLAGKKPWALQLRRHESLGETEYYTLAYVNDDIAREIIRAGATKWLFGEPDWEKRAHPTTQAMASALKNLSDSELSNAKGRRAAYSLAGISLFNRCRFDKAATTLEKAWRAAARAESRYCVDYYHA